MVDGYIEKGHSVVVVDILEASRLNNSNSNFDPQD